MILFVRITYPHPLVFTPEIQLVTQFTYSTILARSKSIVSGPTIISFKTWTSPVLSFGSKFESGSMIQGPKIINFEPSLSSSRVTCLQVNLTWCITWADAAGGFM